MYPISCANTAGTHAVKVRDDLIENPETLDSSIVDALFSVEIRKVGDGSKHHPYFIVRLTVQLLQMTNDMILVCSDVILQFIIFYSNKKLID